MAVRGSCLLLQSTNTASLDDLLCKGLCFVTVKPVSLLHGGEDFLNLKTDKVRRWQQTEQDHTDLLFRFEVVEGNVSEAVLVLLLDEHGALTVHDAGSKSGGNDALDVLRWHTLVDTVTSELLELGWEVTTYKCSKRVILICNECMSGRQRRQTGEIQRT